MQIEQNEKIDSSNIYSENNKRLAKNTLVLYIRQGIVLLIQLYVTRLVLSALGAEDYGVYNVVASVVVSFSFLNAAMSLASQRFITYELGKGITENTSRVFSSSLIIQIGIASSLFLLLEIIGLWMINDKLNIPLERLQAANWAFQFSLLTFYLSIIRVPYDATVIAYEKLTFFAYTGIVEVILRLLVAIIISNCICDRLIIYTELLLVISIIMFVVYVIYCRRKFDTCYFSINSDKNLYKRLFYYTGWSLIGSGTNILTQQGFIFLINIYYGVVINAAMGIANQVNSAISGFTSGFLTSYRPQIIKSYAQKDITHVNNLIFFTSKISFALLIVPVLLLIFNMHYILGLWLCEIPIYTVRFCQIMLICVLIDAVTTPYNTAIMATEEIKLYQLCISCSFLLDLVISYFLIINQIPPYFVLFSRILTRGLINMQIGILYIKKKLNFEVLNYLKLVILPALIITILLIIILILLSLNFKELVLLLVSTPIVIFIFFILLSFMLFSKNEREHLIKVVKSRILHKK
jgi:O-antigen/teichoic acid export membrane protein